ATSSGTVTQQVDNATTQTGNTYCNSGAITIPSTVGASTPYPSHITISGAATTVGKVTVQLKNVSHNFAGDIDVLLVGPTTANLMLVSDAGGSSPAPTTNVSVTFDDGAAAPLSISGPWGAANSSVTAQPVNYNPLSDSDTFPAPAPAPSANTTLGAAFGLTNPNGTWSLYV